MLGFGTKKRESKTRPIVRNPFAVIPVRPDCVEVKYDSSGMIHLRLNVEPRGIARRFAEWLHHDYTRKIELDENGTFYYSMVDGNTTLDTITERMAKKLGKSRQDVEGMVVLFTKKLMVMNMLALKAPEDVQ